MDIIENGHKVDAEHYCFNSHKIFNIEKRTGHGTIEKRTGHGTMESWKEATSLMLRY